MKRFSATVKADGVNLLFENGWEAVIIGSCERNKGFNRDFLRIYGQYLQRGCVKVHLVDNPTRVVRFMTSWYKREDLTGNVLWLCDCSITARKAEKKNRCMGMRFIEAR